MDFFALRTSAIGEYGYTRMFVLDGMDIQIQKRKKKPQKQTRILKQNIYHSEKSSHLFSFREKITFLF